MQKFATIESGARLAHPAPTAAQAVAGNYRKGRAELHGLKLAIETPRGGFRCGVDEKGQPWSVRMPHHYGDISGTRGADGDPVDVFVGPLPESESVFVVNQAAADGSFDEHKVMLGFATEEQAREGYLGAYSSGWDRLMSLVATDIEGLKRWLKQPGAGPVTPDHFTPETVMDAINWNRDAEPVGRSVNQLHYALRAEDADDGLLLDACTMADLMSAPELDGAVLLDALVVEVGRLKPKMESLLRVMAASAGAVKPVSVDFSDPVKARGVLNVMVLFQLDDGQTISIWMHNPDTTPTKLTPLDELISWKWMLNKRDITIVVAPERGRELDPREVARRVMKLVEKNSAAFKKANANAVERAQQHAALDAEIVTLTGELAGLNHKLEVAREAFLSQEMKSLVVIENDDVLPEGWTEATPGGMATSTDPETGGIVDVRAVTGEWFVIPAKPGLIVEGEFSTRADAFAALALAVANQPMPVPEVVEGDQVATPGDATEDVSSDGAISSWDSGDAEEKMTRLRVLMVGEGMEATARRYIAENLQGLVIQTKIGKCVVSSVSRGKLGVSAGRKGGIKMLAIPRIPEILIDGEPGELEPLREKVSGTVSATSILGFVPFIHTFVADSLSIKARVMVGKREVAPSLVYSLDVSEAVLDDAQNEAAPGLARLCTGANAVVDLGRTKGDAPILDDAASYVNSVNEVLNLEILEVHYANGRLMDLGDGEPVVEPASDGDPEGSPEARWTRMTTSEREAVAQRAGLGKDGKLDLRGRRVVKAAWKSLMRKTQELLAASMDGGAPVAAEEVAPAEEPAAAPALRAPTVAFASATPEALNLLAISEEDGAAATAFKTAKWIEAQSPADGLAVSWEVVGALPEEQQLDDALFPELGSGGYLRGTVTAKHIPGVAGYVYLKGDGSAMWVLNVDNEAINEQAFDTRGSTIDGFDGQWGGIDMTAQAMEWIGSVSDDLRPVSDGESDEERAAREAGDAASDPIEAVDAAYVFSEATDEFKLRVSGLKDEFETCRAMDQAAKASDATISWEVSDSAVFDSAADSADGEAILDGDFPGHPFRGNQHEKGEHSSGGASWASRSAKQIDRMGDDTYSHNAHDGASKSHKIAASKTKGKTKKYHETMADFHEKRANHHREKLSGAIKDSLGVLDDAAGMTVIEGVIKLGSTAIARAVVGGDGKAMVYVGADGARRVTLPSGNRASWGDDAAAMVLAAVGDAVEAADGASAADGVYPTLKLFQAQHGAFDPEAKLAAEVLGMGNGWRTHGKRLADLLAIDFDAVDLSQSRYKSAATALAKDVKTVGLWVKGSVRHLRGIIGPWVLQCLQVVSDGEELSTEMLDKMVEDSRAYRALAGKDDALDSEEADQADPVAGAEVAGVDGGDSNIRLLQEVVDGKHDAEASDLLTLGSLLRSIDDAINGRIKLNGALSPEEDALAQQAVTKWAQLDEKVHG